MSDDRYTFEPPTWTFGPGPAVIVGMYYPGGLYRLTDVMRDANTSADLTPEDRSLTTALLREALSRWVSADVEY